MSGQRQLSEVMDEDVRGPADHYQPIFGQIRSDFLFFCHFAFVILHPAAELNGLNTRSSSHYGIGEISKRRRRGTSFLNSSAATRLMDYLVEEIGALCKLRPQRVLSPVYPEISGEGLETDR